MTRVKIIILLIVFLFYPIVTFGGSCTESNGYLVCEDWDADTPPDPWPTKDGEEWHNWTPADYGNCDDGDITTDQKNSGTRSLMLLKADGKKSTVDLTHAIAGSPGKVYVRFYLYIPSGETTNVGSFCHLVFLSTSQSAEVALDFRKCGEYDGGYYDCTSVLGGKHVLVAHSYNPEQWIGNNQAARGGSRTYFPIEDHEAEWILVEWMVDFDNDKTSLWINETAHVIDYDMAWSYATTDMVMFSGFSLNTSGAIHYYFDDIIVDETYVGPRGGGGAPEITVTNGFDADLSIDFGTVAIGETMDCTVTVKNDGTDILEIETLTGLAAPFSLVDDNCTDADLNPTESCTCGVRFSPTSAGSATQDTLIIPSNDDDESSVSVTADGAGANPNINVGLVITGCEVQ